MGDREPYVDRLRRELGQIEELYARMLDASTIVRGIASTPDVFVAAPPYQWGVSSPETTALQMETANVYTEWVGRVRLLFPHAPAHVQSALDETDASVRAWIDRAVWTWSLPASVEEAKTMAAQWMSQFRDLLDIASNMGAPGLRLVPDTNSLLRNPDLASYARSFEGAPFTLHLVPTVLGELDRLKDQGKSQEVRDKARSVSRRLKGLRDKGRLSAGVNLTKGVVVRAEAREPQVKEVVDWLDPSVPDDRVVASALRLQSDHPAATVVLVTSDLNMQTKADAIGLPYEETPPTPASLKANLRAEVTWVALTGQPHAQIRLTNTGPARARDLTYSLMSIGGPLTSTAGPWRVAELRKDASNEQAVFGFCTDPSSVTASWTDDGGEQHRTWQVAFPSRPGPPGSRQAVSEPGVR